MLNSSLIELSLSCLVGLISVKSKQKLPLEFAHYQNNKTSTLRSLWCSHHATRLESIHVKLRQKHQQRNKQTKKSDYLGHFWISAVKRSGARKSFMHFFSNLLSLLVRRTTCYEARKSRISRATADLNSMNVFISLWCQWSESARIEVAIVPLCMLWPCWALSGHGRRTESDSRW